VPLRAYRGSRAGLDRVCEVLARRDTPVYRAAKMLRRPPVALPAGAAALLFALAGSAAFTWRLADERDRARAAEDSARRGAEFIASLAVTRQRDAMTKVRPSGWGSGPTILL
jgi:hypothetical protein